MLLKSSVTNFAVRANILNLLNIFLFYCGGIFALIRGDGFIGGTERRYVLTYVLFAINILNLFLCDIAGEVLYIVTQTAPRSRHGQVPEPSAVYTGY